MIKTQRFPSASEVQKKRVEKGAKLRRIKSRSKIIHGVLKKLAPKVNK